jgi:hypothetical protein
VARGKRDDLEARGKRDDLEARGKRNDLEARGKRDDLEARVGPIGEIDNVIRELKSGLERSARVQEFMARERLTP